MKSFELNLVPEKIKTGTITVKEAVDSICSFVIKNYPMFGLYKYDEDFRSEIILSLLEKGEHILSLYNPDAGEFFNFIYCYITTLVTTRLKTLAKQTIAEKVSYEEAVAQNEEKQIKYQNLNFQKFDFPKVPYAYKPVPAEELRKELQEIAAENSDKKILVLALKSSFYLTDEQVSKVCRMYKIDEKKFYEIIQFCKESVFKKIKRRDLVQERRNYAYYNHKKSRKLLDRLEKEDKTFENKILMSKIVNQDLKYRKKWNSINKSFQRGILILRPTNKTVANLLGICERQVAYYLNCAKNDVMKKENPKMPQ